MRSDWVRLSCCAKSSHKSLLLHLQDEVVGHGCESEDESEGGMVVPLSPGDLNWCGVE
jgi:hypothetical protein